MARTLQNKQKLVNRIRRLKGQIEAVERGLETEMDCSEVLHRIAACKGAVNSLMSEVIEGHLRFHVLDPDVKPNAGQTRAAQELINIVKGYLR